MNQSQLLQASYQQKLLWQIVRNKPELPYTNINLQIKFEGFIDQTIFLKSWIQLIAQEESLRASFHEIDGDIKRRIHSEPKLELDFADIREKSYVQQYKFMQAFVERTFFNPMPMEVPLAIRGCLFQLGDEDFQLIATFNHMGMDGLSIAPLFQRLAEIYEGNNPSELPSGFKSFLEEQNRFMTSMHEKRQIDFWRQYLEEYNPSDRFTLQSAPEKLNLHRLQLPHDTMQKLAKASEGELAKSQIILKAAYLVLLAKAFELEDIGVFSILANRSREYRTTIGYLANIVIYRTVVKGDPTLQDILSLTKLSLRQVSRNAKLPYLKIWREIFNEDASRIPRFFFNLIPQPDKPLQFGQAIVQAVPGLSDWIYWNGQEHYTLGLTVYMALPGYAGIEWRYDNRIFTVEVIQAWSDFYLRIVNDLLDSKNSKLSEISYPYAPA